MGDRLVGLVVMAVGAAYLALALDLPTRTLNGPGPGVFPLMIAAALLLTGALAGLRPERMAGDARAVSAPRAPLAVLASLALFCLLFQAIGYLASGVLVVILVLRAFAAPWRLAVPVAAMAVVVTWIVFVPLLGLTLPRGPWPAF